jgi:mycofactocin precursor
MDHATAEVSAPIADPAPPSVVDEDDDLAEEEELLVEEISIDGMCGVY